MKSARKPVVAGLAAAAALVLAGCGGVSAQVQQPPATLTPIAGSRAQQVELTPQAAQRLGITVQAVRVVPAADAGRAGAHTMIPYPAVVYDTDGSTWTYVQTAPQTFVRHRIAVADIEGAAAFLIQGPAAGALVVTRGAPELLGAEYDISGEE